MPRFVVVPVIVLTASRRMRDSIRVHGWAGQWITDDYANVTTIIFDEPSTRG
jgi:hypothetical protein